MSYGSASYGEVPYASLPSAESPDRVVSEGITTSDTTVVPGSVYNPLIVDDASIGGFPAISLYDSFLDVFEVDDSLGYSITLLISEVVEIYLGLLSSHIDSRAIAEDFQLNDFHGKLEYLSDILNIIATQVENKRKDGYIFDSVEVESISYLSFFQILIDLFSLSDSLDYKILGEIIESFNTSDILQSNGNLKVVVVDNLENNDRLIIGLPTLVADSLNLNDTSVGIRKQLVSVLNNLVVDGTLTSVGSFITHQGDVVNIVDAIGTAAFEALVASLTSSDSLSVRLVMSLGLSSSMSLSEAATEYLDRFIEAVSNLVLNDENSTQTDGVVSVSEEIDISHFFDPANMQTWLMNPENYAVYNYSFQFNQATNYNNDLLMADDTGLFVLEGDNDNGENIVSVITTSAMNFGAESLKQVPSVLLGTNGTDLVLKVSIDGERTARYEIGCLPENLETKRIKLGKGLIGNNWQFTLITDNNSKFDLDSFEFYPIVFKRKHNG